MKGQTLIEVLVALGIITVVTTALAAVVITSMSNAQFSKNQNLASQYALEGMEIVRRLRDSDYVGFRNKSDGIYCLDKGQPILPINPVSVCATPNVDNFIRKVEIYSQDLIKRCDVNLSRVIVTVSWQDGKCPASAPYCHSAKLESCLSNINPVSPL
jgi:hypothetical protein